MVEYEKTFPGSTGDSFLVKKTGHWLMSVYDCDTKYQPWTFVWLIFGQLSFDTKSEGMNQDPYNWWFSHFKQPPEAVLIWAPYRCDDVLKWTPYTCKHSIWLQSRTTSKSVNKEGMWWSLVAKAAATGQITFSDVSLLASSMQLSINN
jgi:hypothetical protein